jgi:membrane protein YqaA with SNARE-associated domain
MLRRLYDWVISLAASRHAIWALIAVSFAESSFFPIPPDIMLIPMILADRRKAWLYALVATIASVIGGLFGYAIGYFLFETVAQHILDFYGKSADFANFTKLFNDFGVWIIVIKGMTPIPYKILTIAAGVAQMNLIAFMLASLAARAMRFFLVAGLLYWFGEPIRTFVEKRLTLVLAAAVVLIISGFVALRFVG